MIDRITVLAIAAELGVSWQPAAAVGSDPPVVADGGPQLGTQGSGRFGDHH